jgi:hypothetical protein
MIRCLSIIAAAAVMAAASPAEATIFCQIKQSSDGFVALRSGPSPTARLVARMRPGDEVKTVGHAPGLWQEVEWWRGDERLSPPGRGPRATGWVNRRLIEDCG